MQTRCLVTFSTKAKIGFHFHTSYCYFAEATISRWMRVVSKRNVQELDLSFVPAEAFKLPHCLVTSESLRVLKLYLFRHVVQLPSYVGFSFSQLRTLDLESVEFVDEDLTRSLFSGCPLLETLNLLDCVVRDMEVLDITSASLTHLTIDSSRDITIIDGNGYWDIVIKISCPNLLSFDYVAPVARNYFLENVSSLEVVCIFLMLGHYDPTYEEVGRLMCEVLENISNAADLTLSMGVIRCITRNLDRLEFLCITFHRLKTLTMSLAIDEHFMTVMVLLLKYSPNLEVLTLDFEEIYYWSEEWELQDDGIACLESTLKLVRLKGFRGDENELKLVRFLLKHGLVLEKMIIVVAEFAEEYTPIAETILGFPKSSPDLAVIVRDFT